jgi:hypothetical protein
MSKSRTPLIVGGIVSAVLAVGLIIGGGALVWADHEKDSDGYLTTTEHRFAAKTAALSTENIDVDLGGADWVVNENHLGKVRLKADPANGKDVFVGIARTSDVGAYLRGVSHTTVTDVDYKPFDADYADHAGRPRATPPASSRIWAASAQGPGVQKLDWKVKEGNWSVVVMNADGSPGVSADIRAGASLPFLTPLAWGTLGTGLLFAVMATVMLLASDGPRRQEARRAGEPAPAVA